MLTVDEGCSPSLLCAGRTQIVSGMAKTAKKAGKTRKSVQVEAARVGESRREDDWREEIGQGRADWN